MRPSTMKHEHRITIFSFYYTRKGPSTFHLRKTSGKMRAWAPTPHTLHPACYTLHPAPYTTHPSPCMLRPTPYTLHPTPYNLHPAPYTLHPTPYTLHPQRFSRIRFGGQHQPASDATPSTLNHQPSTLHFQPSTLQGYLAHKKQPPPLGPP